jgi:putative FmdB family regulatory protein
MPIYEYECPHCGIFEAVQKASDKPLKCNPDCKHSGCPKKAKRVMSASAFHLKGSGWYKTDYASSGSASTAGESGSKKKGKKKDDAAAPAAKACGTGCGCH